MFNFVDRFGVYLIVLVFNFITASCFVLFAVTLLHCLKCHQILKIVDRLLDLLAFDQIKS